MLSGRIKIFMKPADRWLLILDLLYLTLQYKLSHCAYKLSSASEETYVVPKGTPGSKGLTDKSMYLYQIYNQINLIIKKIINYSLLLL